jgi:hypothetical protein
MIEGLRTDSLFLIPGVIRASQALGLATFLVTGAILLIQARRPHDPSRLYLNRIQYELTDPEPGRDDAGEDPQP